MDDNRQPCAACYGPLGSDVPHYARLCRPCFTQAKRRETAELQRRIEALEAEVERLRGRAAPVIDATMLRRLIQLCHPDKHSGCEAAATATRWLIEQRDAARRVAA
jgi:hypothetical protein